MPSPDLAFWSALRWGAPLGAGAQARVWSVHHGPSGRALALRVVRASARRWTDLRAEARLLAAFDHPNIIAVHDLLRLPDDGLPEALAWAAGAPVLVMEQAEASLDAHLGGWTRESFAGLAHDLLRGVGVVAGHGRMHLDIKPGNVLAVHRAGGRLTGALADFGVATPTGAGGTERYMAPEQRRDAVCIARTDLYALGLTLSHIATGAPPDWESAPAAAASALRWPELAGWLARMTERDADQRFPSAAHAAAALKAIGGVAASWSLPERAATSSSRGDAETQPVRQALAPPGAGRHAAASAALARPASLPIPRLDTDGTSLPDPLPRRRRSLATDGSGLWSDRVPALVGRSSQRRELWDALARSRRAPVTVRLAGSPGAGRRRLAGWLAVQAHAVAGATTVVLDAAALRSDELALDALIDWLRRAAPRPRHPEGRLLADELANEPVFRTGAMRDAALAAWLEDVASRAPVVVVTAADDHALPRLQALRDAPARICWVRVADRGPGAVVEVPPLAEPELRRVLADVLRVDERLARTLAVRSGGLPGRALALLDAWTDAGAIEATADGLELTSEPPDVTAADRNDLPAAFMGAAPGSVRWLVTLLLAGGRMSDDLSATLPDGFTLSPRDADRWQASGLLTREPRAWQTPLSVADVPPALRAGPEWRDACDAALGLLRASEPSPENSVRAARLHRARGDADAAVEALLVPAVSGVDALLADAALSVLDGIEDEAGQGLAPVLRARYLLASGRHDRGSALLAGVDIASLTPVGRALAHESGVRAALILADPERAAEAARDMERAAHEAESPELQVRAKVEAARVAVIRRRPDEALAAHDEALALGASDMRRRVRFTLNVIRTHALLDAGRGEEAYRSATDAVAAGEGAVEAHALATAANDAGDASRATGRHDEARAWYERALELSVDRFPFAAYVHANLAWLDIEAGRSEAAIERIDAALARLVSAERSRVWWLLRGLQLGALASPALQTEWDAVVQEWSERDADGVAFEECARAAAHGASRWRAVSDAARATAAEELAARFWAALGRDEDAEAAKARARR